MVDKMTYIISDIHGEYELFMRLLDSIKFSDSDALISCGDIIDKGQDSVRLLNFIANMSNARCINGNHEYDFLKYYWSLMRQSPSDFDYALKKLQEYFPCDGQLLGWDIIDWIESRPYFIEEKDYICVHAGAPLDNNGRILPLEKASTEQLVYDRAFKEPNLEIRDSKCVFFGHTPTSYLTGGESKILVYKRQGENGNKITNYYKVHLDLGTWLSDTVGVFCVETLQCIYYKNKDK